jgi:hypothetical protein
VIIVIVLALVTAFAYYGLPCIPPKKWNASTQSCEKPSAKCAGGVSGSCATDKDCGGPTNGSCGKNAVGDCVCACADGYSGANCENKGIPWTSPQCMGPNTAWPARHDQNGMCVCPPGYWASGHDAKYGYVQCLGCAGAWGPLGGSAPCTGQWGSASYLSTDCYHMDSHNSCGEFSAYGNETGPAGAKGSVNPQEACGRSGNSCRCAAGGADQSPMVRTVCRVTGWLDPSKPSSECPVEPSERPCPSYQCHYD